MNPPTPSYIFSSLDKLSMANVPPGDPRLWVHLASVYVVSYLAMRVRGGPYPWALRLD
jgi:hypothetical protein